MTIQEFEIFKTSHPLGRYTHWELVNGIPKRFLNEGYSECLARDIKANGGKDRRIPQPVLTPEQIAALEERKNNHVGSSAGHNAMAAQKKNKNDEYYTPLSEIAREVKNYDKEYFTGKRVVCPCDKVSLMGRSNFFNYFAAEFSRLGLKELICIQYNPEGKGTIKKIDKCTISDLESRGTKFIWCGEKDGVPAEHEVPFKYLEGDGSFDSPEVRAIMMGESGDGSDVVVCTNPPFSRLNEFIGVLLECGCKFLTLGNINAITYSRVFPAIMANKLWHGYGYGSMEFILPEGHPVSPHTKVRTVDGLQVTTLGNICWYTNIPTKKCLTKKYLSATYKGHEDEYQHLINDESIIEIGKPTKSGHWIGDLSMLPKDYPGIMAVPITFLNEYNPDQFEIVGNADTGIFPSGWQPVPEWFDVEQKRQYNELNPKNPKSLKPSGINSRKHNVAILYKGNCISVFKRLLIRLKNPEI